MAYSANISWALHDDYDEMFTANISAKSRHLLTGWVFGSFVKLELSSCWCSALGWRLIYLCTFKANEISSASPLGFPQDCSASESQAAVSFSLSGVLWQHCSFMALSFRFNSFWGIQLSSSKSDLLKRMTASSPFIFLHLSALPKWSSVLSILTMSISMCQKIIK